MGIRAKLFIDVEGDEVVLIGKKEVVSRAVDLSALLHVDEIDGFVRAVMWDPIPHRRAQVTNGIILDNRLRTDRGGSSGETKLQPQKIGR